MKKLLAILLTVAMLMGVTCTAFADSSTNADGWTGAVIVTENPADGTRDEMVKISSGSSGVLDAGMAFNGVVELSLDVYAPDGGTIALTDGEGNPAGTISLADGKINEAADYDTAKWNTVKLFAMTGTKTYQVYIVQNEADVFVAEGTAANAVVPTQAVFTAAGDMYVDNVEITELRKSGAYPYNELTERYVSDNFTSVSAGASLKNAESWDVSGSSAANLEYYSYTAAEFDGERVVKMETIPNSTLASTPYLRLTHALNTVKSNHVIETKLYIPSEYEEKDNNARLYIYLRSSDNNAQIGLLTLQNGAVTYTSNQYQQTNAYPEDTWFTLRIEILYETQSFDVYVGTTRINPYPIPISSSIAYGEMPAFKEFGYQLFYLRDNIDKAVIYAKDIKFSQITGVKRETVFSESFDGVTAAFTHTPGGAVDGSNYHKNEETLTLTSGATKGGVTGVGDLYAPKGRYASTSNGNYRVTEDCPLPTDETTATSADYKDTAAAESIWLSADEHFYSKAFDLSGAEKVNVKYKFYNAACARRDKGKTAVDTLYTTLTDRQLATTDTVMTNSIARPFVKTYRATQIKVSDAGTEATEGSINVSMTAKEWHTFELEIDPSKTKAYTVTIDGTALEFTQPKTLTKADMQTLKYLNFALNVYDDNGTGGRYYLDDVSVEKTVNVEDDYVKSDYAAAYRFYADGTKRDAVAEISLSDNRIETVTIKYASAVTDDSQVFVAVYDNDGLSKVAIFEKEVGGVYAAAEKELAVNEDSVIKVFCFDKATLTPQGIFDVVFSE